MLKVDEFESAFRSAGRERFELQPLPVAKVLVVTDLAGEVAEQFVESSRRLLACLGPETAFAHVGEGDFSDSQGLLAAVEREQPDLICCYRNVRTDSWRWPFGAKVRPSTAS